jgi:hypothetical protein
MDMSLIFQALQASRQRKLRQAETALSLVPQGTIFGELSPDQQKSVVRATGRKYQPDEVVSPIPLTADEAATDRLIKGLGLDEGSTLAMGLRGALASKIATGKAGEIATPEQLAERQAAAAEETTRGRELGTAVQKGKLLEAEAAEVTGRARVSEAGAFESAVSKLKASTGGAKGGQPEFSQEELAAYQHFNNFIPSQPIADQLTGQARAEVMKQALRLAADPDSASFAKILKPLGVTPSDAIGAFALGIGSVLDVAINRKAQMELIAATNKGQASEIAAKALFAAAEDISKRMGGAYSPTFIAQVMEGDPKMIATPAGQMVQRFTSSGFTTALTELAVKGDPAALSMKQLLDVARIPQIASNEKLLAQYSNLAQNSLAATLTRSVTGLDRPMEAGKEQQMWDAVNTIMMRKTAGVFAEKGGFLGIGKHLEITPEGGALEAQRKAEVFQSLPDATRKRMEDSKIVDETLRALFGDITTLAPDTTQGVK